MMEEIIYEVKLKRTRQRILPFYLFSGKLIHIDTDSAIFQLVESNALVIVPFYVIDYMMPSDFGGKSELENKYKALIHQE